MAIRVGTCRRFRSRCDETWGRLYLLAQCGEAAEHVKPFKGVGSGVMEIAERYATDAYRLVYTVQLGKSIYVLHV